MAFFCEISGLCGWPGTCNAISVAITIPIRMLPGGMLPHDPGASNKAVTSLLSFAQLLDKPMSKSAMLDKSGTSIEFTPAKFAADAASMQESQRQLLAVLALHGVSSEVHGVTAESSTEQQQSSDDSDLTKSASPVHPSTAVNDVSGALLTAGIQFHVDVPADVVASLSQQFDGSRSLISGTVPGSSDSSALASASMPVSFTARVTTLSPEPANPEGSMGVANVALPHLGLRNGLPREDSSEGSADGGQLAPLAAAPSVLSQTLTEVPLGRLPILSEDNFTSKTASAFSARPHEGRTPAVLNIPAQEALKAHDSNACAMYSTPSFEVDAAAAEPTMLQQSASAENPLPTAATVAQQNRQALPTLTVATAPTTIGKPKQEQRPGNPPVQPATSSARDEHLVPPTNTSDSLAQQRSSRSPQNRGSADDRAVELAPTLAPRAHSEISVTPSSNVTSDDSPPGRPKAEASSDAPSRAQDTSLHTLWQTTERPSTPVRAMTLAIQSDVSQVQVRVSAPDGELRVAVHTADAHLNNQLRSGLGQLVEQLRNSGSHAETSTGSVATTVDNLRADSGPAFSSLQGQQTGSESQPQGGQERRRPVPIRHKQLDKANSDFSIEANHQ